MAKTALVAIGGNSLIRAGEKGTIAEQLANTRRTAAAIVHIIRAGFHVVVTHGNGPQVGAALLRSERAADQKERSIVPRMSAMPTARRELPASLPIGRLPCWSVSVSVYLA